MKKASIFFLGSLAALAISLIALFWHGRQDGFRVTKVRTPRSLSGETLFGKAVLSVGLPDNPTAELRFMIPLDPKTRKPLPSASNIVFRAPFLNEDRQYIREYGVPVDAHFYLYNYGWTVFTLAITPPRDGPRSPHYYVYPESGWHEVALECQKWLQKKYKLSPRRLIILGESSGGSMAEQMVATYPEQIAAAAWNGGTTYRNLAEDCLVSLMAFNTWGCFGGDSTGQMVKQSASQGIQVLWEEGPPIWNPFDKTHHGSSAIAQTLCRLFLKAVMEMADDEGKVPPPSSWPIEAAMPDGRTLRFPSEEFYHEWQKLPLALNNAVRNRATTGYVAANEAIENPSRCFVVFCEPMDGVLLRDCVYALSRENLAVWVVFCGETISQAEEDGMAALASIRNDPQLDSLPVTLIGFGGSALAVLQLIDRGKDSNIDQVYLLNPFWDPETPPPQFAPDGTFRGIPVQVQALPEVYTEDNSEPVDEDAPADPYKGMAPVLRFFQELAVSSRPAGTHP